MKYFKVSYSSDSLEGLSALSGKQNSSMSNDLSETSNQTMLPPDPDSGTQEISLSNSGQGEFVPPPVPSTQNSTLADQGSLNSDQLTPPPFPNSGDIVAAGADRSDLPAPPMPDSVIGNVVRDQSDGEFMPPPSPVQKVTKTRKKS